VRQIRTRRTEKGIALLISIFMLLLISVVAIALIVSSSTETALAGNYRASTGVYYAALSGLEETRARLLSKNPDAFKTTNTSNFLPSGTALNMGDTYYLINPVGGEAITPWDSASTYPDNQFGSEFGTSGFPSPTSPSPTALSVWNRNPLQALGLPGPLYKWVRINAVSEKSLGIDVDADNLAEATTPLYFGGGHFSNSQSAGPQVLELTSFAILPNGSQKLLQYLVTNTPINFPVPPTSLPALTLAGSVAHGVAFNPPNGSTYYVSGVDLTTVPSCTAGPSVPAIGVLNSSDVTPVINGIPGSPPGVRLNYTGSGSAPNVVDVGGAFGSLQTPSQFETLVKSIIQNADVIYPPGPTTYPLPTVGGSTLSAQTAGMTSSNPMTIVINGDLDLNGWHNTGYGLLLVTGNLNYDPDASWQGIVMVIGQGTVTGSKGGSGEFDGAFIVAKTRDASGNLLPDPDLGTASIIFAPGMGGVGIRYSSCWIQKAMPTGNYRILSFHEISQ